MWAMGGVSPQLIEERAHRGASNTGDTPSRGLCVADESRIIEAREEDAMRRVIVLAIGLVLLIAAPAEAAFEGNYSGYGKRAFSSPGFDAPRRLRHLD